MAMLLGMLNGTAALAAVVTLVEQAPDLTRARLIAGLGVILLTAANAAYCFYREFVE